VKGLTKRIPSFTLSCFRPEHRHNRVSAVRAILLTARQIEEKRETLRLATDSPRLSVIDVQKDRFSESLQSEHKSR
jgi:hypothetical protein